MLAISFLNNFSLIQVDETYKKSKRKTIIGKLLLFVHNRDNRLVVAIGFLSLSY